MTGDFRREGRQWEQRAPKSQWKNSNNHSLAVCSICHPSSPADTRMRDVSDGAVDDPLTRLRSDLQRLRDSVDAIDRRDAAQHGGLKGEIAHLVRRIARLEAIPRPRPVR